MVQMTKNLVHSFYHILNPRGCPPLATTSLEQAVCAKLVQNMINDSFHHLFSELQHAEFKEAFNEFDKVRIYIFYYRVSHSEKCKVNQI